MFQALFTLVTDRLIRKSKYGKYGYRRGSYYSHSKYAEAAEENQAANSSESVSPNSAQAEQIAGQDHKDSWGARY